MTQYRNPNLLLFLFFAIAILAALLLPTNIPLQAAPAFQSGVNTPTPTATSALIPTPTPTAPPDISQSSKTVSQNVATLGDVLTYTIAITKSGPPARLFVWEWFDPTLVNFTPVSHTEPANYSFSYEGLVWDTMTPAGLYTAVIVYQAQVQAAPPGGVFTNTAHFFPFGGARATRQASTLLQTPTPPFRPTLTPTPLPTATPRPTATASPTATRLPAPTKPLVTGPKLPATPDPGEWQPPPGWPKVLPETGER